MRWAYFVRFLLHFSAIELIIYSKGYVNTTQGCQWQNYRFWIQSHFIIALIYSCSALQPTLFQISFLFFSIVSELQFGSLGSCYICQSPVQNDLCIFLAVALGWCMNFWPCDSWGWLLRQWPSGIAHQTDGYLTLDWPKSCQAGNEMPQDFFLKQLIFLILQVEWSARKIMIFSRMINPRTTCIICFYQGIFVQLFTELYS